MRASVPPPGPDGAAPLFEEPPMIPALLAQNNPSHWPTYVVFLIIVLVGFAIILCIFLAKYVNLWIQAKMT